MNDICDPHVQPLRPVLRVVQRHWSGDDEDGSHLNLQIFLPFSSSTFDFIGSITIVGWIFFRSFRRGLVCLIFLRSFLSYVWIGQSLLASGIATFASVGCDSSRQGGEKTPTKIEGSANSYELVRRNTHTHRHTRMTCLTRAVVTTIEHALMPVTINIKASDDIWRWAETLWPLVCFLN